MVHSIDIATFERTGESIDSRRPPAPHGVQGKEIINHRSIFQVHHHEGGGSDTSRRKANLYE